MPTHDALLGTVFESPEDDAPRLVYADFLEENGGSERAEFIRVQCELARLPKRARGAAALRRRERALLAAHELEWRATLPDLPGYSWGPFVRGFPETLTEAEDLRAVIGSLGYPEFHSRLMRTVRDHPHVILPLSAARIAAGGISQPWHDAALSYLPDRDWPALATMAVNALVADPENDAAEGVLSEITVRRPTALHRHLDAIFEGSMMARAYYGPWPWRESGRSHFAFLRAVLTDRDRSSGDRTRAWACLLETRDPENLAWALDRAASIHRLQGRGIRPLAEWVESWLAEVGLTRDGDGIRELHGHSPRHIVFPEGHFESLNRPTWRAQSHPSWGPGDSVTDPMPFGGASGGSCGFCGGSLHHLITLDPVPDDIGVTGLNRLSLAVCLSCLGWEHFPMRFAHGKDGKPRAIGERDASPPRFVSGPLRPTEVRLGRAGSLWRWQSWAGSNGRENLHRVGGAPAWVQGASYPPCETCHRKMRFLMQLDSGLPTADGREWLWGSGGVAYGFWCDGCKVSAWHWQCT